MLVFCKGLAIGASLLVVIGPQNAHVLRMGLSRQHVFLTALICSLCDALLIILGISGLGLIITAHAALLAVIKYGGAAFLFYYGCRSMRAAFQANSLTVSPDEKQCSARQAVIAVLAMSLLNPHVYLDAVMLIGTVGAQQAEGDKFIFGAGAATASVLWFFSLAYGARLLIPYFARPRAWQILDVTTALIVWMIGVSLLV